MQNEKNKRKSPYTIIENHDFQGRQSHNLTRILKTANGHKLAIRIKRDSYDFQSHAKAELWSDAEGKWHFVHAIPYPEMASLRATGTLEQDAEVLLKIALAIIE